MSGFDHDPFLTISGPETSSPSRSSRLANGYHHHNNTRDNHSTAGTVSTKSTAASSRSSHSRDTIPSPGFVADFDQNGFEPSFPEPSFDASFSGGYGHPHHHLANGAGGPHRASRRRASIAASGDGGGAMMSHSDHVPPPSSTLGNLHTEANQGRSRRGNASRSLDGMEPNDMGSVYSAQSARTSSTSGGRRGGHRPGGNGNLIPPSSSGGRYSDPHQHLDYGYGGQEAEPAMVPRPSRRPQRRSSIGVVEGRTSSGGGGGASYDASFGPGASHFHNSNDHRQNNFGNDFGFEATFDEPDFRPPPPPSSGRAPRRGSVGVTSVPISAPHSQQHHTLRGERRINLDEIKSSDFTGSASSKNDSRQLGGMPRGHNIMLPMAEQQNHQEGGGRTRRRASVLGNVGSSLGIGVGAGPAAGHSSLVDEERKEKRSNGGGGGFFKDRNNKQQSRGGGSEDANQTGFSVDRRRQGTLLERFDASGAPISSGGSNGKGASSYSDRILSSGR